MFHRTLIIYWLVQRVQFYTRKRREKMIKEFSYEQQKFLKLFAIFYKKNYQDLPYKSEKHIMSQTMCYFLRVFLGEYIDFTFTWNTQGPHSDGLERKLNKIDTMFENGILNKDSDLKNTNLVIELRDTLQVLNYDLPTSKLKWLELLSSLDYIKRYEFCLSGYEKIKMILDKRNPHFDSNHVKKAWEILEQCDNRKFHLLSLSLR